MNIPGEGRGNPSGEGLSSPLPRAPSSLLPKTFDEWGGGAAGVRSGVSGNIGLEIKSRPNIFRAAFFMGFSLLRI